MKKKVLILTFIISLTTHILHSQIKFSVKAGFSLTNLTKELNYEELTGTYNDQIASYQPSYFLGLKFRKTFKKNRTIFSELFLENQKLNNYDFFRYHSASHYIKFNNSLYFLNFKLGYQYNFNKIFVFTGINYAKKIANTYNYEILKYNNFFYPQVPNDLTNPIIFKDDYLGIFMGSGYEITRKLSLEIEYKYSFNRFNLSENREISSSKNLDSFSLGLTYNIN